jgi:hypothetical protein
MPLSPFCPLEYHWIGVVTEVPFEWTAANTDKVLNAALDLAKIAFGAILGAKLTQWQKRRDKRADQEHRLSQLVLRVRTNPVANDMAGELISMRNFFLNDCPELLRSPGNQDFFGKWLNDPTISLLAETRASGFWTKEKLEELNRDLGTLEHPK